MNELLLDEDGLNDLREAIGFEQLRQDFLVLVKYVHELHGLIEQLAGEPVVEAQLKVAGGMGQKLSIERNISRLDLNALKSVRLPKANNLAINEVTRKVGYVTTTVND